MIDEEFLMKIEHHEIIALAERRWALREKLKVMKGKEALIEAEIEEIDKKIRERSFYFCVGDDGLVDLGLGCC